jgi:hypothetical protein
LATRALPTSAARPMQRHKHPARSLLSRNRTCPPMARAATRTALQIPMPTTSSRAASRAVQNLRRGGPWPPRPAPCPLHRTRSSKCCKHYNVALCSRLLVSAA